MTGSESWKTSGQERRVQGDVEHKQAQTQGYAEGTKDRLLGKKDQLSGAVTGDTTQETTGMFDAQPDRMDRTLMKSRTGNIRNEKGQAQQDWNKS